MSEVSPLMREYNNFMKWLKENHPDIHEKYFGNFTVPFQENGGVSVNNNNRITTEEHEMLMKVAKEYYSPK